MQTYRFAMNNKCVIRVPESIKDEKYYFRIYSTDMMQSYQNDKNEFFLVNPIKENEEKDFKQSIVQELQRILEPFELYLVIYKFGLQGQPKFKQTEIASANGMTVSQVMHVWKRSSDKIRKRMPKDLLAF